MKIRRILSATAIALAMAVVTMTVRAATTGNAGPPAGIGLGPGSSVWLEGSSNLHEFESRTSTFEVRFTRNEADSAPASPLDLERFFRASGVRSLDVAVPTTSLHSGKAGLDKNLWQDLAAEKYPAIQFHLAQYTVAPAEAGHDTLSVRAEGALTIAGHERPATLNARAWRAGNGLWIEGSHALRMTEFGIKPRTMMLGALRVKDDVVVHYRLLLTPGGK